MGVVVKQENKNTYKTHRILMPNGAAFVYNENTELTTARGVAGNGSYASPISSASEKSIAPSDGSVKYSLRENDRKYMDAVEQGDTAEAQKLVDAAAKAAGYKNLFYHGAKKGGGFTTFRGWSYFTENKGYAQRYSESGNANSL